MNDVLMFNNLETRTRRGKGCDLMNSQHWMSVVTTFPSSLTEACRLLQTTNLYCTSNISKCAARTADLEGQQRPESAHEYPRIA